jgi:hypothetical protein
MPLWHFAGHAFDGVVAVFTTGKRISTRHECGAVIVLNGLVRLGS